jgi:hypothetical protein
MNGCVPAAENGKHIVDILVYRVIIAIELSSYLMTYTF